MSRGKFHQRDWLSALVLVAAAVVFLTQCRAIGHAEIDDAFFTFSYSRNLALGHGPVYSHGVRVEGYSTFLWMALMALGLLVNHGTALVTTARIVGAPFVVLLGWATWRLARACGAGRLVASLCVLLLSFNTDLAVAYLTGMETLAHVALLTTGFAALAATWPGAPDSTAAGWRRAVPWIALAVGLNRIDGFVGFGFLLGSTWLGDLLARRPRPLRLAFLTCGPPVLVYLIWFFWRWHYYGLPLPSTYYAKALIPKLLPGRGWDYVTTELLDGWLWCGLAGLAWLGGRRRVIALVPGAFVLIHLGYVVKVGGDWMPFGRFVLPVVPLLLVLFATAADDLIGVAARWPGPVRALIPAGLVVWAAMVAARMDHRFFNNDHERAQLADVAVQRSNVESYLQVAEFLRQIVPPGGHLVTDYGGVFSCYTDGALIEMWGLANATIAVRGDASGINPIYGKTCPACYPELQPEYFHVLHPMLRPLAAFTSSDQVIDNVWQTDTIGRYIDFRAEFIAGRVLRPGTDQALYFLQKRVPGVKLAPHPTADGFLVEYPFEDRDP